jgi:hypothetical protein
MKILVKTEWHHQVAVRARFIVDCRARGEQLIIEHANQIMTIPCKKIDELTVGSSDKPVKDKFGNQKDYLIYFKWNPDPVIQKEFIL